MKTTQDMIDVMQAFVAGKEIQILDNYGNWVDVWSPAWNWGTLKYRIKPEDPCEDKHNPVCVMGNGKIVAMCQKCGKSMREIDIEELDKIILEEYKITIEKNLDEWVDSDRPDISKALLYEILKDIIKRIKRLEYENNN